MKIIRSRNLVALTICLGSFAMTQQRAQSQWMEKGSFSYSSEEGRLRALDQALRILEKSDPMVDLRAALQKKDLRFAGFYGYSLIVPEVPRELFVWQVKHGVRFKVLIGSNDVVYAATRDRQNKVAERYMKPYNRNLLRYLTSQNKKKK